MKNLEQKIQELNKKDKWNHLYNINGIKTIDNMILSIGNNTIKWNRIQNISNIDFKNKKVLDLACSDGYFSIQALLQGANYVKGIDLDELRIEKANFIKDYYQYNNIDFNIDDVYDIDLESENYDIIMCLGLLHRIPDLEKLLLKLKKINNILIIETKVLDTDKERFINMEGISKSNKYNKLYNICSFKYLENILRNNGYTNFIFDIDPKDNNKYKRGLIICS